jgi:hypothetical protein
MNSSGIKRGLAATAISALAVTGIPAFAGTAHAAVGSVAVSGVSGFTAFDIDEFATPGDLIATVKETGGTPSPAGTAVEYSYVYTPEGGVPAAATAYVPGGVVAGTEGKANLTFVPPAAGSYTITVRTTGSQIAAPFTFVVGESEITWADGASASSPVNGSDTYTGTLALTNAAKTPLPGRDITVELTGQDEANFGQQTAPSVRVDPDSATSTSGPEGKFTVSLTDPALPAGTTESATLTAEAPALKGAGDPGTADATDELTVNFEPTPVVKAVSVEADEVFGQAAPGKPVELEVTVTSEGATVAPGDDVVLKDYPVSVAVDKGFLSPDTKPGLTTGINDLTLAADQDDEGDLFGSYEDLGASETVDTSDDQAANAAGIIATIAKDAGFNDDGLVQQTVTVTAGGKTVTETITYDVRDYLNLSAVALRKDGGSAKVPGSVDFKLFAADQFGNLVGDQFATVSDDTPVARVVTPEPFGATTDFVNDNPSVTASSSQPVKQTITASVNAAANLVNATGDKANETSKTVTGATTLNWTKGPEQTGIVAKLKGAGNGATADKLTVVAPAKANGAVVKLFKVVGKKLVPAGTKTLKNGKASFTKADKNGKGFTKYVAKVSATNDTKADRSNTRNVR